MTTLKVKQITDRINGYGMPIVEVVSSTDLKVINRGYNEFECLQTIDESDLLQLRDKLTGTTVMLEIITPSRKTNCWYSLTGSPKNSNIMW